jgi:hypothetical protein
MKNGLKRFTFYTDQLSELMTRAKEQEDPAMWLFRNNARTPFFMLEALTRLYVKTHDREKFGKLKELFKMAEDGLGLIDYYQALYDSYKIEKKVPDVCRRYIKERLDHSAGIFNETLREKGWVSDKNLRIRKITRKLEEISWMGADKEVKAISEIYNSAINKIISFVNETNCHFDNVEEDVHELRRKLRWLSIYPQALRGAIVFGPEVKPPLHLKKYLTKEIINSPFNKLPDPCNNTPVLLLNKNYFLALSWMIAELGNLKDEGLLLTGLSEALINASGCPESDALSKAEAILGKRKGRMKEILAEAGDIAGRFFGEKNLQNLIAGIETGR